MTAGPSDDGTVTRPRPLPTAVIPLCHDFRGETVLVVGGGPTGARKARRFAREARTVVLSPAFADADFGDAERVRAAPGPGDAGAWVERVGPALVAVATDDGAVNRAFADAARERGLLVNRADRSGDDERDVGEVVVPATVEDGPVTAALTTGGRSPALSKHLRERIEAEIDGAGAMAALTGDLRERLREDRSPADRRAAVRAVVRSDDVWKALDTPETNARRVANDVIRDRIGETR